MNNSALQRSNARVASSILLKYKQKLDSLPSPGSGICHTSLLGVANLGVYAKLSAETIHQDLRSRLGELNGTRAIPDREIDGAIKRALNDVDKDWKPVHRPQINGPKIRETISKGAQMDEADLWESSPIRLLDGNVENDKVLLLQTLYEPDDLIFIGSREEPGIIGQTIRPAGDWIRYFEAGGKSSEHIIPNPLTGESAPLKGGDGLTFRGDNNVAKFKFIVVEFDTIPRDEQIAFWAKSGLPIYCLIDSGGKSIHGWVRIDGIQDAKRWQTVIRECLFPRILVPMGVDSACKNESRLSRLPGHFRTDKGNFQKLLWLSKEGKQL